MSSKAIPPPEGFRGIKIRQIFGSAKEKNLSKYLPFAAFARDIRTRAAYVRHDNSTAVSRW